MAFPRLLPYSLKREDFPSVSPFSAIAAYFGLPPTPIPFSSSPKHLLLKVQCRRPEALSRNLWLLLPAVDTPLLGEGKVPKVRRPLWEEL